jgi:hypothetical protein
MPSLLPQDSNQTPAKPQSPASPGPSFRMHQPEDRRYAAGQAKTAGTEQWVNVAAEGAAPVAPPPPKPVAPPIPMPKPAITAPKPAAPPPMPASAPKIEPRRVGRNFHLPEQETTGQTVQGKKIFTEASDKLVEIKKSESIGQLMGAKKEFKPKAEAELNLISEKYEDVVQKQFWMKLKSLLTIVLFFVIISSAGFAAIKFYKLTIVKEYNETKASLRNLETELAAFNKEQVQAERLKKRAMLLQTLLDNHVYWTVLFDKLEHNTADRVYYTNFSSIENGDIIITAVGPEYKDAAEQLAILQKADFVAGVEMNSYTQIKKTDENEKEITEVQFNINLQLKKDALLR